MSRAALPDWPRLMSEPLAAQYLSIGTTALRSKGPEPKRYGLDDPAIGHDLDRWADRLSGQPLDRKAQQEEASEVQRRFLEKRRARG